MSLWLDFFGAEVRYVNTPSFGRVRIAEAGVGRPQSLFLMHGIGGHLEAYAKNLMALSDRYHVVAFDFVGHGLSDKPTDIEYLPSTYARQLAELMDALGIEQAHLSGESLGGWVAGVFAVMHPQRVERLVLNTAGGIPIVTEQGRRDLQVLAELSRKNVGQAPTLQSVRARMQWLMHESNWPLLDDELVGTRLAIYQRPDFQQAAPKVLALLKLAESEAGQATMIELEKLDCETLFFWTKYNPVHDVESAASACARVKRGQLYVARADAAHWPQYEAPAEFNRVIDQFLQTGAVPGAPA